MVLNWKRRQVEARLTGPNKDITKVRTSGRVGGPLAHGLCVCVC